MKAIKYITNPKDSSFVSSVNALLGKVVYNPSLTGYVYSLEINDSQTVATIDRFVSQRMYFCEYDVRVVSNNEFLVLLNMAVKAKIFNVV